MHRSRWGLCLLSTASLLVACRSDLAPDASSGAEFESGDDGASTDTESDTDTEGDTEGDTDGDTPICDVDLVSVVDVEGANAHLEAFQGFADADEGNRQGGSAAFDASADYVLESLVAAGYEVESFPFEFDAFHVLSDGVLGQIEPEVVDYVHEETFHEATWTASGEVTAAVTAVDPELGLGNGSTSGCEPEDFAGFPAGDIALVQRGSCTFADKAILAEEAGAAGLVIFNQGANEGTMGLFSGTLGSDNEIGIPVVLADYATGAALVPLADADELVLHLRTDTMIVTDDTINVLASTPQGDANAVVMLGAHLDSVPAGPGINDNGSGSAALLEVALEFAQCTPRQKVTFAFWGAEEWGLVGSWAYVDSLDEAGLSDIAMYLNFDMIASPNGVRGIYDGDGSEGDDEIPAGSDAIEAAFRDHFDAAGLPVVEFGFSGRSDYEPFRQAGVPVGGLATGANGIKTDEQAQMFGGEAGLIHDPCYHQACDDIENPDDVLYAENLAAIADVLQRFASELPSSDRSRSRRLVTPPSDFAHTCVAGPIAGR